MLEQTGSLIPFAHVEFVGYFQAGQNEVQHLDVIAGRLAVAAQKLEGTEVVVRNHHQRTVVGKSKKVLGGSRLGEQR